MNIDVVLITYNQAPYVERALQGIVSQITDSDVQVHVIIADDCSTDGTLQVIRDFEKKRKLSFEYLQSKVRLGMVGNYKRVLSSITSPYCCLVEGDDYWINSYKLKRQIDYMISHPECGLCYTDCSIINEDNPNYHYDILFKKEGLLNENNPLYESRYNANVTWMLKTELFSFVNIPDESMDIPLILMYESCLHYKLGYIEEKTGVYRLRRGSVSDCRIESLTDMGNSYKYKKGVFLQGIRYAKKFPESERTLFDIYSYALFSIYPAAYIHGDNEFCEYIERFFDKKLDKNVLRNFIVELNLLENRYNMIRSSKAYRLGKFLLKPFSFIKNHL